MSTPAVRRRAVPHQATVALLSAATLLAACSGPAASSGPVGSAAVEPTAGASIGPRPSSPALVEVVAPAAGAVVSGPNVHVVLKLTGAEIVIETTTSIRPDQGHVHLYVDNALVSMNYGLEQDVPIPAGTHVIKAEFVAADHAPFDPRVWSAETVFTVR